MQTYYIFITLFANTWLVFNLKYCAGYRNTKSEGQRERTILVDMKAIRLQDINAAAKPGIVIVSKSEDINQFGAA